jgi:class 3 adenylate cyclase
MLLERRALGPDVRPVLRTIAVPTLVLQRADNKFVPAEQAREVAALIPGTRYVELPGIDTYPFSGDDDAWIDEIEHFLTGRFRSHDVDRVLATVGFTDIVDSTGRAARLGDRRWSALLAEHDAVMPRELTRARGQEIKSTGDGFLAAFDGPAWAVRWAAAARDAVNALGVDVRAGVHTGECERENGDLAGIAVHIGARIGGLARPGEVLVSSTVKDLAIGLRAAISRPRHTQTQGRPEPLAALRARHPRAASTLATSEPPLPLAKRTISGRSGRRRPDFRNRRGKRA